MTGKPFLDTNILVYAFDSADPRKQRSAWDILEGRVFDDQPVISTQVIQEFYVTVVRKLPVPLEEKRALEARKYLVQYGIDPKRLSIVSYGESMPVALGQNELSWAKNRRADFVVLSK